MDLLSMALQYAIAPLAGFVLWIYKSQHSKVDAMDKRVADLEKQSAVLGAIVDTIREDIKDIKRGIEKLVERI